MKPIKESKLREEQLREAVALVKKAIKLFDKVGQDIASAHCQGALEVVEFGRIPRPVERVPPDS